MNDLVSINGRAVVKVMYRDVPVVSLGMVDELHERSAGTAKRNFKENKHRFVDGEDFFLVRKDEYDAQGGRNSSPLQEQFDKGANEIYLITETGYLMLVKSFTDELSWKIQRQLVKSYFASRAIAIQSPTQLPMTTKVTVNTSDLVREANRGNRFAQRLLHHLTGMQVDDIAAEIEHKLVVEDFKRAELAANYLDLLLEAEERMGITFGTSESGNQYLQGLPTQFFNIFRHIGKVHGLPMLAKEVNSFGVVMSKEAAGLEFYGWRRSLAKKVNGSRYFRFERIGGAA